MSLENIRKSIEKRDIDKIISLIPQVERKDYNQLDEILSNFIKKETDIANFSFNLINLFTNKDRKKKTPEVGCFQLTYDK